MEKLFVKYEEALALKELGFDEPCFAKYFQQDDNTPFIQIGEREIEEAESAGDDVTFECDAPLYQQAFRWLLNIRQDLCLSFWCDGSGKCTDSSPYDDSVFEFNTELECLKKLIELCLKK
jgi:hypothetical protein